MVPCASQWLTSSGIFTSNVFSSPSKSFLASIFALICASLDHHKYVPALRHHDVKCNSLHISPMVKSLLGTIPLTESNLLLTYPSFHVWLRWQSLLCLLPSAASANLSCSFEIHCVSFVYPSLSESIQSSELPEIQQNLLLECVALPIFHSIVGT
jgi:hypothetical protein